MHTCYVLKEIQWSLFHWRDLKLYKLLFLFTKRIFSSKWTLGYLGLRDSGVSLVLNDIFYKMTPLLQLCWVLLLNGSIEIAANSCGLRGPNFCSSSVSGSVQETKRKLCISPILLALLQENTAHRAYLNYHLASRGPSTFLWIDFAAGRIFPLCNSHHFRDSIRQVSALRRTYILLVSLTIYRKGPTTRENRWICSKF